MTGATRGSLFLLMPWGLACGGRTPVKWGLPGDLSPHGLCALWGQEQVSGHSASGNQGCQGPVTWGLLYVLAV